jgi:hypothetical protein
MKAFMPKNFCMELAKASLAFSEDRKRKTLNETNVSAAEL